MFHHTPDLSFVDDGQVFKSEKVSYSLQGLQPLTCSCNHIVYIAAPAQFMVNGNPQDIDTLGFSCVNVIELDGFSLAEHCRANGIFRLST